MVILGIDPGWDRCGWAKICLEGSETTLIESGLITTNRANEKHKRLKELFERTTLLYRKSPQPTVIALEEIHLPPRGIRISNLVGLGEARGVLLMAASRTQAEIREIHPLVVKNTITGHGRSKKSDLARFLKFLLPEAPISGLDDTTDAIAIALTVALTSRINEPVAVN